MDRLTGMEVFARVVEADSFSAAAERLGVSRAAVSKRIIQLEKSLGVRLLHRTTRRVTPTDIGRAYYERCIRVLDEADDAESLVRSLHVEPRGALRINAPHSFAALHLGPVLAEFAMTYPDIRIDLTLNDRVVNLVEEGYDMALRVARHIAPTLVAERIAPIRLAPVASPDYLAERGAPRTPSDLKHHTCLLYTYQATQGSWHFRGPDGDQDIALQSRFNVNNGDVLLEAAAASLGIAMLPTFITYKQLRSGTLVRVLPEYAVPSLSLYTVHAGRALPAAKVRLLISFLAERFGFEPYWDRIPEEDRAV